MCSREYATASGPLLVYYSPDDVMAPHNLKRQLKQSFDLWDVFFTTKTHNVGELRASGVRHPVLAGNAFDPTVHRPLTAAEAGAEFEAFDLVFIGALERERCMSLNRLAEAGMTVLVHGARGALRRLGRASRIRISRLRDLVFAEDYGRRLHHGKDRPRLSAQDQSGPHHDPLDRIAGHGAADAGREDGRA